MKRAVFTVERLGAGWCILLNRARIGRFEARTAALACALEMAGLTRQDGVDVQVLAEDHGGAVFPVAWSSQ